MHSEQLHFSRIMATLLIHLRVGIFAIAGLASLFALKYYAGTYIPGKDFIPSPVVYLISVPLGLILWVRAIRHYSSEFDRPLSPGFAVVSIACYVAASLLDAKAHSTYMVLSAFIGCIAGTFVFINWKTFLRYAFKDRELAGIALLAISTSAVYTLFDHYLWEQIAHSAAVSSHWIMDTLGFELNALVETTRGKRTVTLETVNFSIRVFKPCSGLEGIFMFMFLLSAIILMDWPMFKRMHFTETYLLGFIYMYGVNVLRIVSLFLFGHFAEAPDASPFMASMRGVSVDIFHSYIGQVYYFCAFLLFAFVLYCRMGKRG